MPRLFKPPACFPRYLLLDPSATPILPGANFILEIFMLMDNPQARLSFYLQYAHLGWGVKMRYLCSPSLVRLYADPVRESSSHLTHF